MRKSLLPVLVLSIVLPVGLAAQYFPERGDWETRTPEQVGMDPAGIAAAVAHALASENTGNARDQEFAHQTSFAREPYGEGVGPFKVREGPAGLIVKDGYIIAEWGDTRRVDMTYSVSKSFLSTTVGLIWEDGLIASVDDEVRPYMGPIGVPPGDGEAGVDRDGFGKPDPTSLFESEHNRQITWDDLLRQTSNWAGTLWGKPDWADRPDRDPTTWLTKERAEPGTVYEYNDTRVNLLALAATNVVRRPLPAVLRQGIMDPIGASPTWRWHGYENSWITLDGRRVQAVSGGGHWGGGMFISARDQARFGLFTLHSGNWNGEQLLAEEWFGWSRTPGPANGSYGFMNFMLNLPNADGQKRYPSAPDSAWAHLGNGTNMIYCDPENNLVVVARWISGREIDPLLKLIIESVGAR
ncbi:MAG: serine hydrolase [Gemmatimonadota bacterium]|nr:serine hydrolase [Gemmatimonadota bacterium]